MSGAVPADAGVRDHGAEHSEPNPRGALQRRERVGLPMELEARRLILGANLSFPTRLTLNATVGYQHFVTNWAAPYARMLVGSYLGERRARLNLGAEMGVKLFGGPMGHLGAAMGATNDGSMYTVVELGLDWVVALTVLAHL